MIRAALMLSLLLAAPARAEMAFAAADLLAAPETALGGAIIACAEGAVDPAAADAAFTGAGWDKVPGEGDGTWEYAQGETWAMIWDQPGFCMVADEGIGTADMETTLLGLSNEAPVIGTDADGCTTYDFGAGLSATLTGPGNDPACTSQTGSALRFQLSQ